MSREQITILVEEAKHVTEELLARVPDDHRLQHVLQRLVDIGAWIGREWPILDPEGVTGQIGLFAVRELEGVHDDLATRLEHIEYYVEHPHIEKIQ